MQTVHPAKTQCGNEQVKASQKSTRDVKEMSGERATTAQGKSVTLELSPRVQREQAFVLKQKSNNARDDNKKIRKEIDCLRQEYNIYAKQYKSLVIGRVSW